MSALPPPPPPTIILNVPLATAASSNNTFSRACAVVVKMAWYGDLRFKWRAVIEFFVADKVRVTNIHKRSKTYSVSVLLIKPFLVVELHEFQAPRKANRRSVTRVARSGGPTTAVILRHATWTNQSLRSVHSNPYNLPEAFQEQIDFTECCWNPSSTRQSTKTHTNTHTQV